MSSKKEKYARKAVSTVNKIIKMSKETTASEPETKGLLNRTSRGVDKNIIDDSENTPLMKVVEYVKQFRKLREELSNGK
tara:strand:- start:2073 stop:2309 length:237 start_codon:yes stop_codon:yes gene_type:complete